MIVAILAAGASRRLGTPKQLVEIEGEALLRRQSRIALSADVGPVIIVLGCNATECLSVLADLTVQTVLNDEWTEGVASSLRHAVTVAGDLRADGLLVLACDQYRVTADDLRGLRDAWQRSRGCACISSTGNGVGPPVILPSDCFPDIRQLRGDRGARSILYDARRVAPIAIENQRAAFDLDSVADLASAHAFLCTASRAQSSTSS